MKRAQAIKDVVVGGLSAESFIGMVVDKRYTTSKCIGVVEKAVGEEGRVVKFLIWECRLNGTEERMEWETYYPLSIARLPATRRAFDNNKEDHYG